MCLLDGMDMPDIGLSKVGADLSDGERWGVDGLQRALARVGVPRVRVALVIDESVRIRDVVVLVERVRDSVCKAPKDDGCEVSIVPACPPGVP